MEAALTYEAPDYLIGVQKKWFHTRFRDMSRQDRQVFRKCGLVNRKLVRMDVWHRLSQEGRMGELLRHCCDRGLVLVGPRHFKELRGQVKWAQRIVSGHDCWGRRQDILDQTLQAVNKHGAGVVLVCAGMTANVMIHELRKELGNTRFLIDFGSALDPYCGVCSRTGMRKERRQGKTWIL